MSTEVLKCYITRGTLFRLAAFHIRVRGGYHKSGAFQWLPDGLARPKPGTGRAGPDFRIG